VPARVHRISAFHLSHTAVGGMKLLLSGKLETVLSTMLYKMAESEFAGKMMRRFTIASEDLLQYLEAWVHGGPEPARRIACLIQNQLGRCALRAPRVTRL
jgi:hypothetical protein